MLKLTRHLFIWDTKSSLCRLLWKGVVQSYSFFARSGSGGVTYFHTLHPGSRKHYQMPFVSHTCCVGTGYENHAKYGEAIYYRTGDDTGVFVNLFIASELNWNAKGIKIRQETSFPDRSSARLTFSVQKPLKLKVFLRYPIWATEGMFVKINGKSVRVKNNPGSYIELIVPGKTEMSSKWKIRCHFILNSCRIVIRKVLFCMVPLCWLLNWVKNDGWYFRRTGIY
jgi:DUF1680 family protein